MHQADQAADFWSQALGAKQRRVSADEPYTVLDGATSVAFVVQAVDDVARYHLDIETDDVTAETERLLSLGAVLEVRHDGWVVLRAPGGHLVCVVPVQSPPAEFAAGAKTWSDQ
jgi:hypothetical protein